LSKRPKNTNFNEILPTQKVIHKEQFSPSKLSIYFEVKDFKSNDIKIYINILCYDVDDYDICKL
jgi:hypothetical protein